jgi:hypothetical protein
MFLLNIIPMEASFLTSSWQYLLLLVLLKMVVSSYLTHHRTGVGVQGCQLEGSYLALLH